MLNHVKEQIQYFVRFWSVLGRWLWYYLVRCPSYLESIRNHASEYVEGERWEKCKGGGDCRDLREGGCTGEGEAQRGEMLQFTKYASYAQGKLTDK